MLPMSNRYSHPSSKKCDFFRCKSRFNCVSAAFQLRFSYVSAHLRCVFFLEVLFLVPKYPRSSKSNFWSNFLLVHVFQLVKTCKNGVPGCSPSGTTDANACAFNTVDAVAAHQTDQENSEFLFLCEKAHDAYTHKTRHYQRIVTGSNHNCGTGCQLGVS